MRGPRVLALVQAGGAGSRMDVLTRERAKPALPFAGTYQLVDFPLSNLAHSSISHVWLSVQHQGSTMEDVVANGRPWDLDRNHEGLSLLMPQQGTGSMDEDGFARGNADGLYRIRDQVERARADVLLVLSADHVYRLDLAEVVEHHVRSGAECTLVTSRVPPEEAGDHATVEAGDDGVVTGFAYKPDEPTTDVVSTEIIAYDPAVLVRVLDELHVELGADAGPGDSGLGDFGEHLVPRLVERGKVVALAHDGYWRDVGTPAKYLRAHRELMTDGQDVLDVVGWPILTAQPQRSPAVVLAGAEVADSRVSPGSRVAGVVRRSVLGPGVRVEAGAVVEDSVVFADTVVGAGARVVASVVDARCEIGEGAHVGPEQADDDLLADDDRITLVGAESTVGAGVRVAAGTRMEPGTTA
jgi:glucose-1-phosphate adenylyltransferase